MREFQADCGGPSFRALLRASQTLGALYQPPKDLPCELHPLSVTALSEILSGKRQGLPTFDWVASFVLSCQRFAVQARPGRRDQGSTILPAWAAIYAAATAGDLAPAYPLPADQLAFIARQDSCAELLLARAQRGHPHARYRTALLLASDPARAKEAAWLLIEVASTGHAPSFDLLDADRDTQELSPHEAAQHAYDVARVAWDRGADSEGLMFCRAAARGGHPQAAIELARVLLAGIDPEAALWLSALGTEPAAGRHRRSALDHTSPPPPQRLVTR